MKSLDTSLPRSPRKQQSSQPPEQLIQAFKTAALSVTNLYKTAAVDQASARESGYQDALDDLLACLDRENIGLGDGEGWRIRQWATERLDGDHAFNTSNESYEEAADSSKREGSDSPRQMKSTEAEIKPSHSDSPTRPSPVPSHLSTAQPSDEGSTHDMFTFRAGVPYPQDTEMQPHDNSNATSNQPQALTNTPASTVRVELVPRGQRIQQKTSNYSTRSSAKSSTPARLSGSGTGSKRRLTLGEYFDIGNLGDFQGGGKRGRFTQ